MRYLHKTDLVQSVVLSATLLLTGCEKENRRVNSSSKPTSQQLTTIPNKQNDQKESEWKGIRGALLNEHLHKTRQDNFIFIDLESRLHPMMSLVMDGKNIKFHPQEAVGIRNLFAKMYNLNSESTNRYIEPESLANPHVFAEVKELYNQGGSIAKFGFSRGYGIPEQNSITLIPGNSLQDSYLFELLGTCTKKPSITKSWDQSYNGKPIELIYTINSTTGDKGAYIGYAVSVLEKKIVSNNAVFPLILRKFVIENTTNTFPNFIVTQPDGCLEFNNKVVSFNGKVVDDNYQPISTEKIKHIKYGSCVVRINAPDSSDTNSK